MKEIDRQDKALIEKMIDTIKAYGLENSKVFDAMRSLPRHWFVKQADFEKKDLYIDSPLPIGEGQTISQPYTVAFMLDLLELKPGHDVLEIGAGSGWNAALMKHIVGSEGKVISIEYKEELALAAKQNAKEAGLDIEVVSGDGSIGYMQDAPYDRIISTCAAPQIPKEWKEQLKEGGIIVTPVGKFMQKMVKVKKIHDSFIEEKHGDFRFVPLRGKRGF